MLDGEPVWGISVFVGLDPEGTGGVCEVVDVVEKPAGTILHLRILRGSVERRGNLVHRIGA